jgi:hypothetical protein
MPAVAFRIHFNSRNSTEAVHDMSMSSTARISSFIQFDPQESFEREYFISHTSLKRYRAAVIIAIVAPLVVLTLPIYIAWSLADRDSNKAVGAALTVISLIPSAGLFLYFMLRKLRISYGYATLTNKRIIYYEYNVHPAVNYHFVKSLYLSDITAAQFNVERTFFRKSFLMALYTEFKALAVGGKSWQGILKIFSKSQHLEPGPDALEFVQAMSGQIAHRQFEPQWSSHTA